MSTIDDMASDAEERLRDAALADRASRASRDRLQPTGVCHQCGNTVGDDALFCPADPDYPDDSCARAYDARQAARLRNGR